MEHELVFGPDCCDGNRPDPKSVAEILKGSAITVAESDAHEHVTSFEAKVEEKYVVHEIRIRIASGSLDGRLACDIATDISETSNELRWHLRRLGHDIKHVNCNMKSYNVTGLGALMENEDGDSA